MTAKTKTDEELLAALEQAVLDILTNPKSKPAEKLSAIAHGTKLVAARHTVRGSDTPDFFGGNTKQ